MNIACSVLVLLLGAFLSQEAARPASVDPSAEFFKKGMIPRLRIQISDAELEKLRADNRAYVRCTIQENKTIYKDVAIKLKGAAGSFREFDDRPALTLNADKFTKGQTFHGLDKFHLNNSVQDETCLQEWLSEELCRAAGIPATRVTHARVWLNDRDVGLYVLKEGFDQTFLSRHFEDSTGNLYDGGFVQDIDADLEKDAGKGPDDHSDLRALLDACREPDIETRWKRIEEHLDVEAFISFMAFELMACHWDGYTQNRNNYRIYFNPTDHKARFLPHGMDQMFGDPNASVLDPPGAIVASTVMLNPAWRKRYRERLNELLPLFDPPTKLHQRVDVMRRRLLPALHGMDPQRSREHADQVRDLKERLAARAVSLREQVQQEDPRPPEFDENGSLSLSDWYGASETEDAVVEEVDLEQGKKGYSILCGPSGHCIASWRRRILLAKGTYTFHANVKTSDVAPLADERGSGAGLRISGELRANKCEGTSDWKPMKFEFTIEEETREVELVAELRTTRGRAWFAAESLRLFRQLPPEDPGSQ